MAGPTRSPVVINRKCLVNHIGVVWLAVRVTEVKQNNCPGPEVVGEVCLFHLFDWTVFNEVDYWKLVMRLSSC